MNNKYFAISVDSLLKTFTVVDAGESITFQVAPSEALGVSAGDCVLGYVGHGVDSFNMAFVVKKVAGNVLSLAKTIERDVGVSASGFAKKILPQLVVLSDPGSMVELPSAIGAEIYGKLQGGEKKVEKGVPSDSLQQIAYGAPGTGKSYGVKKEVAGESVIRTTFHPDSDYATFVGAYKPTMEFAPRTFMKGEEIAKVAKGDANLLEEKRIVYKFVPQAFLQAYEKAWTFKVDAAQKGGTAKRQYLVIEEINRGNCAQIFGDLFQLLDRNDAGFSDYEIVADEDLRRHLAEKFADAAKANAATSLDLGIDPALAQRVLSGEALLLPNNLFIRATMNTSDQSLFPIDSAFKRRWDWKYVPIAKPKDKDADWKERVIVANGQTFDWWRFLEIVNAQILEATKSEDKQLGYFFVKAPDATGEISASQFTGKVLFYLYNDVFRDETPPENLFGDGSDGNTQYRFKMFFDEQGEPKEDVVAAFLAQLFKKNPEKGKPAEASAGDAAKGTDEA